jgi:eukaryotic-like serine/threonine-protein kinase
VVCHITGSIVLDTTTEHPIEPLPVDRRIGTVVGRYKLSAVLGRGGSGTVYLGERADEQYSARVAVKVLAQASAQNLGMRFRLERQILASLNHPNIARLIDAGETDDGQPYLVMEYVEGAPVHRYCDERQLGIRERLNLFMEICGAVQYAHQNLVVHRDLKPQNVLVTAGSVVKLLDFGIAKLLETNSATVALTRMHERVLTLEYASPEQVRGDSITTSTDVYSLGVMLFEILTGTLPFPVSPNASQVELERLVCLTDAQPPSAAVVKLLQATPENMLAIAAARNLTPERLEHRLIGDIDAIVLRALRKEAEHRYASVEQFSADLRRHLNNEPVQARQGNWVYYSQRFMRRHTATVAVGTTFVVGLIGVAIAMSVQARRIAVERDRAEIVSEFMTDVFAASDPFVHQGKELTAGDLLDAAAEKIRNDLKKEPGVRARLLEAIGRSFVRQGFAARAIPHLEEAAAIQRNLGLKDVLAASILTQLAISYREAGRFDDAMRAFDQALAMSQSLKEGNTKYRARLLEQLGQLELWRSNPVKAEEQFKAALAIARQVDGARSLEVASILNNLAIIRLWVDDPIGAEQLSREAVSIYHSTTPELYPDRVAADNVLGDALLLQERAAEASAIFETVLKARRQLYSERNVRVAEALVSMSDAMRGQGRTAEAEKFMRQAIEILREGNESDLNKLVYPRATLGRILLDRGTLAEAEEELRAAFELSRKALGEDHQYTASAAHYLGEGLLRRGKLEEAEMMLTSAAARWRKSDAAGWRSARSDNALAEVWHRRGRTEEARLLLVRSFRALESDPKAEKRAVIQARQRLKILYPEYLGNTAGR